MKQWLTVPIIAECCLQITINQLIVGALNDHEGNDEGLVYACQSWGAHGCNMDGCPEEFRVQLYDFLSQKKELWLDALKILEEFRLARPMLESICKWLEVSENMIEGVRSNGHLFQISWPNT